MQKVRGFNQILCEPIWVFLWWGVCVSQTRLAIREQRAPCAIGLFNYASVKQNRQHSRQLERKLNGEKRCVLVFSHRPVKWKSGSRLHCLFLFSMNYWSRCVCARPGNGLCGAGFCRCALWKHKSERERERQRWKCECAQTLGEKPSREIASKYELSRLEYIGQGNCSKVFGLYHHELKITVFVGEFTGR